MSGLKVVDDQTFEVTLSAPTSIFPTKLGYSAFMPLPDAFFTADAGGVRQEADRQRPGQVRLVGRTTSRSS